MSDDEMIAALAERLRQEFLGYKPKQRLLNITSAFNKEPSETFPISLFHFGQLPKRMDYQI